jgi:hypothetical protein
MNYDRQMAYHRYERARRTANGLAWFSIGLGLAEVLAPRMLARSLGMRGKEGLLRFYGMREIACGVGILMSKDPTPWVMARVGGDVLDATTLTAGLAGMSSKKANTFVALGAVAGVTVLDYTTTKELGANSRRPRGQIRDYSDRSGLPRPPEAMRGAWRESAGRQRLTIAA